MRNCRNCGAAPKSIESRNCLYCGTPYSTTKYYKATGTNYVDPNLFRTLYETGYAVLPKDAVIEILRIPTPGQKVTI